MFEVNEENKKISMIERDFGITLPIKINIDGTELTDTDKFIMKILKEINGETIMEKVFENITDNTLELKFTEEESNKLEVGNYYYDIDWFKEETFLSNILAKKKFVVKEKAGA